MKSSYPSYKQMKQELDYDTLYKWIQIDNLTYREIMNKYHYQERLVSKLAKEWNIPYGKGKQKPKIILSESEIEEICSMYANGCSSRTIGKKFKIEHSTVLKILYNNEVNVREAHDSICYATRRTEPHTIQSTDSSGYKHVIGYNTNYREHRYIMEQILGRKLSKEEHVHHIDFNKENNNPNNLFLFESNHKHHLYHGYIMKFPYISPQEFIDKYNDKINWLYSYDTLYDLYINKKLSCNKISKMYPEISTRTPITNALKKFGIYYLRQPSVNQFD